MKSEKETKTEKSLPKKICISCKAILPELLDRGICPTCGVRNRQWQ